MLSQIKIRSAALLLLLGWCINPVVGQQPGGSIPKRIIQTSPRDKTRADWDYYEATLRAKNPDYEFLHFDDEEALAFIERHFGGTRVHETYLTVTPIMKTDIFRLAAILTVGGFYFDMDVMAKQPLDKLVDAMARDHYDAVFPKEWWMDNGAFHRSFPGRDIKDPEDHWQVGNYAFGAVPDHPFVRDVLEQVIQRCNNLMTHKTEDQITDLDILATTGPYVLTEVYHKGRKQGLYQNVLHMRGDSSAPVGRRSHGGPDWHKFGPYGEHMLSHSWVKTTRYLEEYDTYGESYNDEGGEDVVTFSAATTSMTGTVMAFLSGLAAFVFM